MARDTDDDAPWLAEGVPDARGAATLVPRGRFIGAVMLLLVLVAVVAGTLYVLVSGKKSNGASVGVVRAEDAPLITADKGPYKIAPTVPGGLAVEGTDQTMFSTSSGADPVGTIDVSQAPEAPLDRPAASPPATGKPTPLLPDEPPASAVIPPAPVAAPATLPPREVPHPASPVARPARLQAPTLDAAAAETSVDSPRPPKQPDAVRPDRSRPAGGGASLQLGAFSTAAKAEAQWAKVSARHPELAGLPHSVASLERDGATLYRLRVRGVGDGASACTKLAATGDACLVAP